MREVNFSIPNVNKASVYITATLYDRRALDCTSTLPLINSLNHLAYLTTSSARIRDILTVDGGVERLVCILKEGRSKDDMHMWKWNLAFQCIVNIGVRGTEPVRTRVVEADMVPVIATILYDYILVIEREKAKSEQKAAAAAAAAAAGSSRSSSSSIHKGRSLPHASRQPSRELINDPSVSNSFFERQALNADLRHNRRQAPPAALDIQRLAPRLQHSTTAEDQPQPSTATISTTIEPTSVPPVLFTSPPERTTFARPPLTHASRSHDGRARAGSITTPGPATAVPSTDTADIFSLRPVRDIDRLPSMLPPLHTGVPSQPGSPTTPLAPPNQRSILSPIGRRLRRPSIRHQLSNDDVIMEDVTPVNEETLVDQEARIDNEGPGRQPAVIEIAADRGGDDVDDGESVTLRLDIPVNLPTDDNVDIAQQTPTAATALVNLLNQAEDGNGESPAITAPGQQQTASPAVPLNPYTNFYPRSTSTNSNAIPIMPRDDDVLMGLQLLAYISKYCDLRHYFQATHLVPRLRIDREVEQLYGTIDGAKPIPEPTEDDLEEYLQPDDYNIFPLVEKFTVPVHSKDMQYWACVVMRNLCRKDDQKGGIRQCASYMCGKWEEYPRQFAKCRRCRRTKYCSKECQRESWSMHRHWCQAPPG